VFGCGYAALCIIIACFMAFVVVGLIVMAISPLPEHHVESVPTPVEAGPPSIKVATTNCGTDSYAALTAMRLSYGSYDPKYHVMLDDCQTIWVDASDITTADPQRACMFTSSVASEWKATLRKGNIHQLVCRSSFANLTKVDVP